MAWYQAAIGVLGTTLFWVLALVLLLIVLGTIAFLVYQSRVYNKNIKVYAYMGANKYPTLISVDKARVIKKGKMGEQKFWLKRNKVFRTAYGRMMAPNEYWFIINPKDGMWVNFVIGDLDAKLGVIDIEPTDPNARTFYVNNSSMINNKFDPQGLLDKWLPILMPIITLIIIFVGGWYMMGKFGEVAATQNTGMLVMERVAEKLDMVVTKMDLLTSTSGVRPA